MSRKKIMIDMDDVLVSGGFLYLINEFLNSDYKEDDFDDFYMQNIIEDKNKFFDYFFTKNMYDHCTLSNNVVKVLKRLNKKYDIFIGTSYIFPEFPEKCGIILSQKYDFLIKNFPFLNPYNFIFLGNKSILNCDIKIDDKIENLEGVDIKILYTAFHNKNITDEELNKKNVIRKNNWNEIEKYLMEA